MSGQKCTVCGESSVIKEGGGTVCINCGTLHSEQTFLSENSFGYQNPAFLNTLLPAHAGHLKSKQDRPAVRQCKAKMRSLCAKLTYSYAMIEAANNLFDRAYAYGEFKRMHSFNKNMLSHCCVYITGRQFNFPVTIKEFCAITRQPVSDVAKLYHKLITKLHIDIQYQSIASLITYHLSDPVFNGECFSMVKDILKLYERKRTSCSPHRDVTIGLAAFLAWGSMNFIEYSKCSLKQFAKKHKFIFTSIWRVRLKELTEILTQVGSRLPWISNITGKHFVVNHLKDILEFQNSLLLKDVLENDSSEEGDEKNESESTNEEAESENDAQECEDKDLEDQCECDENQSDRGCMYMYEVPDNDDTCSATDQSENENSNGKNTQNQPESICVEIESANPKRLDYADLAGKTFVYHSTLRVITADLPST
ncbi:transcription factor IIIB 50 kDa subunit-like [Mizuhopecten yessoensis]|uniref:Transcription factor IIIB 50 kDa subunit n=1 Tax=Mizuhopecten yessoensis TaxID=6573 RepID=A0A210QWT9_MIZYE|nr:transcription factor IIIB 50 kDa subunit-like [Mizuhopecten yessoensis]OWF53181.1 Transcription factor IIIB 50 kDa subunit [Mizuhopecten yessoensis]